MARPQKEGLDYFPHDTDAVNDEKLEALRALYGNDGYAFFFILLERIYRSPNAEIDISDAETLQILARKVSVTQQLFSEMMQTALKWGCFDKSSYEKRGVLTSNGVKKRASPVIEKRVNMRLIYNKDRVSAPVPDAETTPETPQSKVKKSKEKKSKVDNIIIPDFIDKEIWNNFLEMRKNKRAMPTEHAKVLLLKKLEEFRDAGDDPNEILKRSIMNGWTSIWPLDKGVKGGAHKQGSGKPKDSGIRIIH